MAEKYIIGKYVLERKLGEGTYGSVYIATDITQNESSSSSTRSNKEYAVKVISNEKLCSLIEVDLLMRIKHPNIIRGVEVLADYDYRNNHEVENVYLVQELADTDLYNYLEKTQLSLKDKTRIMFEIGSGLQFLRDKDVLHCDIKTSNILMINDRAMLADMGLSAYIGENINVCGSLSSRAPELLSVEYGRELADYVKKYNHVKHLQSYALGEIWSYGIICLDILYNKNDVIWSDTMYHFFKNINDFSVAENKREYILNKIGKLPDDHIPLLELILKKLLVFDLNDRVTTFNDFIQSSYFSNINLIVNNNLGNLTYNGSISEIYDEDNEYYGIITRWLINICKGVGISNRVSFLTLALVKDLIGKYEEIDNDNYKVFGSACIYLAVMVIGDETDILQIMVLQSRDELTADEILTQAIKLLEWENGMINRITLYDYLSSVEMLKRALEYIKDGRFSKMDTKDIADEIILRETANEANNRKLKNTVNFDGL